MVLPAGLLHVGRCGAVVVLVTLFIILVAIGGVIAICTGDANAVFGLFSWVFVGLWIASVVAAPAIFVGLMVLSLFN